MLLQRVVHEPRAVHRLDHRPHPPPRQALRETAQPIAIRGHRGLRDHLAALVQQANVDPTSTQIQSNVQHQSGPPRARSSLDTPSVPPRRPSFIAVHGSGPTLGSGRAPTRLRSGETSSARAAAAHGRELTVVHRMSRRAAAKGCRDTCKALVARSGSIRPMRAVTLPISVAPHGVATGSLDDRTESP